MYTPGDFTYFGELGSGAFGKVRKCHQKEKSNIDDVQMDNSSTSSNSENTSAEKNSSPNYFAVKLQSKFQLVKSSQESHLYNEISIMSSLDHPLILKMKGVA